MTPAPVQVEELAAGAIFTVTLPADGQTYQVITNQEPNAPASETPTAMLEGCVTPANGVFSTGFANILALGNGVPSQAIECRENRGAYDPNDKHGYPLGYGANNNIEPGTRLTYAIRFQNTGTDTAFNVVIRDTVAEALDLSTFKPEGASHNYTVDIDTHRVVTFTFANIMLPDSNVNLAASQGVVNFSIDHVEELSPGDRIENKAAIYFDFNEPIITNVSQHQIAKEPLPTGVRQVQAQQVQIGVFPNPSNGLLQLNVPNRDVMPEDVLTVTDLYGRPLARTTYGQLSDAWDVRHLPAGYYLLIVADRAGLAKGRAGFVLTK
ncbi:MAG: T9SS type A sorting domain-containing protein, partial [Bacteroidota bacterium]